MSGVVFAGHAAVVSALLENYTEIEVDPKNGKGITPLIKACVQGKSKCAKLLLSHGERRAPPIPAATGRQPTAGAYIYIQTSTPDCAATTCPISATSAPRPGAIPSRCP